jgi:hypothetical protein
MIMETKYVSTKHYCVKLSLIIFDIMTQQANSGLINSELKHLWTSVQGVKCGFNFSQ